MFNNIIKKKNINFFFTFIYDILKFHKIFLNINLSLFSIDDENVLLHLLYILP